MLNLPNLPVLPSCMHPELTLLTARRGPEAAEHKMCSRHGNHTAPSWRRQGTSRTAPQLQPNLFQRTMQIQILKFCSKAQGWDRKRAADQWEVPWHNTRWQLAHAVLYQHYQTLVHEQWIHPQHSVQRKEMETWVLNSGQAKAGAFQVFPYVVLSKGNKSKGTTASNFSPEQFSTLNNSS